MSRFFRTGSAADEIYCTLRDGVDEDHVRGRQYFERLWQEVAPYVDPDAADKATRCLASVFWELQLAYVLKMAGKSLVPRARLAYKSNKGPDLFAESPSVWLEAVVVRGGTGPDAIRRPEMNYEAFNHDHDSIVLRLRSVIEDKSTKFQKYIADGIVKEGQATVIAISGVALPSSHKRGNPPPEIVRAVYPANNHVIEINRRTGAISGHSIEYRDSVQKKAGAEVRTDVFLDAEFKHVSAVLYGDSDWVDPASQPGADFKIVHNSTAVTPLPDGWFPAGDEYWWRAGGRLECRRNG